MKCGGQIPDHSGRSGCRGAGTSTEQVRMAVTVHDQRGIQMARDVMAELTAFVGSLEKWEMDLSFDPDDAASVEAAIAAMEEAIDSRAYRFPGNDPVMDLA